MLQEWPPGDMHPQGYAEAGWGPVGMLDLKRRREAVMLNAMHSPLVKLMLKAWAAQNRIIPWDQKDLATAIRGAAPQSQRKTWWRQETGVIKQQVRARGMEISQDQLLSEGQCADIRRQFGFDDHILVLCHRAALNAWSRVEESGKRTKSFTEITKRSLLWFFRKIDFSYKDNDIRYRT